MKKGPTVCLAHGQPISFSFSFFSFQNKKQTNKPKSSFIVVMRPHEEDDHIPWFILIYGLLPQC